MFSKWFEDSCLALARKDKTRPLLLLLGVTVKTFTIQNQGQTVRSDYCWLFFFKRFFSMSMFTHVPESDTDTTNIH